MRGEGLIDQGFGHRDVARLERGVAAGGSRRHSDAGRGVDKVVHRAPASTARLAQEPAEPGIDVRRARVVARPPAPRASVEDQTVAEMLE